MASKSKTPATGTPDVDAAVKATPQGLGEAEPTTPRGVTKTDLGGGTVKEDY